MIIARINRANGTSVGVLGLSKTDLSLLVKHEVLFIPESGTVIVYAEENSTLEASVRLASSMLKESDDAAKKPDESLS